ncbi:hypothetical protein FOZ63_021458, partial [Perkinsus olseni]
ASLRHVNINELCAAAQALIWASSYVDGTVRLHVDNECVRAWIERFLRGEACISDIVEALQDFRVCRVDSEHNTSDVLTRVDEKFAIMMSSLEGEGSLDIEVDLGEPTAAAALVGNLVYDDLALNHGVIIEAQYDDEVCYKVRRALQAHRLVPESVPIEMQQVLPDIAINEYDVLVR